MSGYADTELLISQWLGERLNALVRADPKLPSSWSFSAPAALLQRGQGYGDSRYNLDTALIDLDWYARVADHARDYAERSRYELRVHLPGTTFPSGVLVTAVDTVSAPSWAPDPSVYRRTAAYLITLAGMQP